MIDFFAWLGLAYDRNKVDPAMIEKRIQRTGNSKLAEYYQESIRRHSWMSLALTPVTWTYHLWIFLLMRQITGMLTA